MLTKAATHIRPLLRLQQHAHQPDLFTSNPSLLHHFQPAGVSNSLVAAQNAQAAGSSGGSAGGAGRSGYSGTSSGGGYTGHARAFLSLPQGPGADASSLAASAEDRKDAAARQRAHLTIKQRMAARREEEKQTRVVSLRDELAARTSRPVKLIEMEPQSEDLPPRRSSIAYPAWNALPEATPNAPLWMPGTAPRGARAIHSRARPRLVSASPAPDASRIEQPNRVFMDLAGLDIVPPASPTRTHVRRNSTASVVRPEVDNVPPLATESDSPDKVIWDALRKLNDSEDANQGEISRLIDHYRTPRGQPPADAQLAAQFPLPAGYSTQTYNQCLNVILTHRQRGESIAPILDIYNEMLERDVVPNMKTTLLVIRALCLRESDVAAASHRWTRHHAWREFKRERLGIKPEDTEGDAKAAAAIEAYQSEGNLASAIKLYDVAEVFYPKAKFEMAGSILEAASASAGLPSSVSRDKINSIIDMCLKSKSLSSEHYQHIFAILAAGGKDEIDRVRAAWAQFQAHTPKNFLGHDTRFALGSACDAFIACGEVDAAIKIVDATPAFQMRAVLSRTIGTLTQAGHVDRAWELFVANKDKSDVKLGASRLNKLAEALAASGEMEKAGVVVNYIHDNADRAWINLAAVYGNALAYVAENKPADREQFVKMLEELQSIFTAAPCFEADLLNVHTSLIVEAGVPQWIPPLLMRFGARLAGESDMAYLRQILIKTVTSPDATLETVLRMLRAAARFNLPISSPTDSVSIPEIALGRYLEAHKAAAPDCVALDRDEWFRLMEVVLALPGIESGAADAALETLLSDLAAKNAQGQPLPASFNASPIVGELVQRTLERFGIDRATELCTAAFGEDATASFLPTPGASVAASSDASFALPTPVASDAPPSALQPPSAHTLHIAPKLDQMIDRLLFPSSTGGLDRIYAAVRKSLTQDNEVPSPEALGRFIAAIARQGDEPKVRELYSLAQVVLSSCISEPTVQAEGWRAIEDSMIAACCFLGHLEQAGMHRARIIESGMVPSADAYATMIASSRDSTDEALVARELFDESQSLGVVPHLYLYNTIISKLSKARKAEMALELFMAMKTQGIRPSSVTYGAVINACCRVGDAESAANLFEEMASQRNFKPRVPPFNTMMQLHLQTRPSRERVLYYYDCMRKARVRPSAHTYKLLLDAYGTLPPIDLAAMDNVFNDLCRDQHVAVQGTHWASLITAFGIHAGDLDRAVSVFESVPSHPSSKRNTPPEPVVWEAILNVVGQVGTLEQLTSLHDRFVASGAHSTAYVCNVLISGYSRHGALERARAVFEGMGDSLTGFAAPNNHPALLTSSGHIKPSTTAPETSTVFREPSTYEAMIRAELASGNREAAELVLRRMEDRRYPVAVWMKARAIIDDAIVNPVPPTPRPAATEPATPSA